MSVFPLHTVGRYIVLVLLATNFKSVKLFNQNVSTFHVYLNKETGAGTPS